MSVARFLSHRIHHPAAARLVMLGLLTILARPAQADPPILPDYTLPPSGKPLCNSNLIQCLDIDDYFAGHLWGHVQVLPQTKNRDTAALFPFGVTLGIFGRVVGSIGTRFAFWNAGGDVHQQLGPLRFSLTGRLLPLFPLFSSGASVEKTDSGGAQYLPPRGFRLGLSFEQEIRVSVFEGANSLGLLTNLAMLRLIGSKTLGPFEVTASLGALYDWQGQFATGEVATQLGLYLPFFRALKIYVEALGRGVPVYVKKDVVLPALDPTNPIPRQGIFGGGLSFQPRARVDLGVGVQAGVGGLAPWAVTVRFLTITGGKNYDGQAATPLAQLAADVTEEFVSWAAERIKSIDPYLKSNCVLYDDNHQPMGKLGELAPDGVSCIYQGLRVPIGPHFWRDRRMTRICNDQKLTDCFLSRADRYSAWEPIHPLLVGSDCFVYHNGQPWMRAGTPTADKQGCANQGHVMPIGQTLKPSRKYPGFYCYDEPDKLTRQTEKLWCLERPERPQNDGQYIERRWAGGIDRAADSLEKTGKQVHDIIDEGAAGVPLHATTPVKEAEAEGRQAIATIKNANAEDAKHAFFGALDAAKGWWNKPLRQKAGDVAEETGDTMASPTTWAAGAGPVFSRGTRALSLGADALADAEKLGKEAKHLGKAAKKAGAAIAAEDEAIHTAPAWTGAQAYHSPPTQLDAFPTAQRVQQKTSVQGGGKLRKRWKDPDGTIYEWDSRHGTVEKYTKQGRHLGEFDPESGIQLKPRDPSRRVEK